MGDIKIFKANDNALVELPGQSVQIEKSLQTLMERNLETTLGVRFLATEYSTGPVHKGIIDTLGLDENSSPVIIEYKRATNENVINQGLFYLDWLLDHKKEFEWLVMDKLGAEIAKSVDWSSPRLLCIAGGFTRYDEHAVKQNSKHIELLRYIRFGQDLLMLELINNLKYSNNNSKSLSVAVNKNMGAVKDQNPVKSTEATSFQNVQPSNEHQKFSNRFGKSSPIIRDIFEALNSFILGLGDGIELKENENYLAYKRLKNFICVINPQSKVLIIYVKLDPESIIIESGFTRDMRKTGHWGTGDLEVSLRSLDDLLKAQPYFQKAYENI